MAFEFTIEQKAADEILKLTEEIKNFNDQKVSQGDKKNAIINKNINDEVLKTSLSDRTYNIPKKQIKEKDNTDKTKVKNNPESDQKIDINNYKDISITKDFREKYKEYLDDKNLKEKEGSNVPGEICGKLKIVDIKRGGVEGGAVIELKGGKKYMLKGLHKEKGKYLYKPNAENSIHAFFTREGIDGINKSVIEEYVALKLANVVHKEISPDVKLGKIGHKDNKGGDCKYQYCLMTEMAVQKKGEGEFSTLEKFFEKNPSTNKPKLNEGIENRPIPSPKLWQNAFAVSVLLLNDRDVNKLDNIGIVSGGTEGSKLSLFDLGHPTPDKFQLDPKTLLPESPNILDKILLWVINLFVKTSGLPWTFKMDDKILEQLGGPEDRAETIKNLLNRENDIYKKLDEIKSEFQDLTDRDRIDEFKSKIKKRFEHLKNVLNEYEKANEKQDVGIEMVGLSHKQV